MSQSANAFVLEGGVVFGMGKQNLLIDAGRVLAIGVSRDAATRVVDVSGRYLVPGFIDSHVHLAYYADGAAELTSNGIVAVLDLGSPIAALSVNHAPLRVLNAGPMITAPGGYPTNAWGKDGYGLGVASAAAAAAAVDTLFEAGVQAIKVPLTEPPTLDDATVKAVVAAAHAHQLKVYSHALEDQNAARAAKAGIDVLAHTPTEPLSEATLEAWKTRTVISTLSAFGGSGAALNNLRALRQRGARVLYGTDFGNTRETSIQSLEITQLLAAGMDGTSIVLAGTSVPAEFLGLTDLGSLEVGKRASFLVLAADPTVDPHTLSQPIAVYVDGTLVSAGL
ncbi:MAG TPA: amidohydrolase family protein [Polyangiaceae bacterium]|nr:amidohydrolase family protein [Polyangiaceae bacterium]